MEGTARERAEEALRAHAPELGGIPVVELGEGTDNGAYAAGDLVLRVARGGGVAREAELLRTLAGHLPLAVPVPRFADEDAGVLAYARIPGQPLLGRPPPAGAAARLGRFLRDLHAVDPSRLAGLLPVEDPDPGAWLAGLDGPPALVAIVRAGRPQPSERRAVAHADLGAEHVLELDGTLTGVIDWSDAAVTDPAVDFARLYRDFGPAFLDEVLAAYGPLPDAMPRIEFYARCAALEDLAYGRAPGRHAYAANAERSFAWLFPS